MTRPARSVAAVLILVVCAMAAGCAGTGPPAALPKEQPGHGVFYVALGGDDNVGSRSTFADAWPQQLFRSALSRESVFVNLADGRSGITEVRSDQLPTAVALHPDVVTITLLDDAERATDPAVVESDVRAVATRLDRINGTTVLVGTTPPGVGAPDASALDAAIRRGAAGHATVVDLGSIAPGDPTETAAGIARAFARALPASARR